MMRESHTRSASKSIIWRLMGIAILGAVTYAYTRHWIQTSLITVLHHAVFLFIFYAHERAWQKSRWQSRWKYAVKAFTYETVLGNIVLAIISYAVTRDLQQMTRITLTYIGIKHFIYVFNEWEWERIKWGLRRETVYAYVCGDILHTGHIRFLRTAKQFGDYLIVGVLTDEAVMEKKPRPTVPFDQRVHTIKAIRYIDRVVPQRTYSPLTNVQRFKPDVLIESDSHQEMPANSFVRRCGGRVVVVAYTKTQSSNNIKRRIRESA